jgi:hypothetical protein
VRSALLVPFAVTLLAGSAAAAPTDPAAESVAADSIRYAVTIADRNLVGATLTNYGVIGNNFVSRSPSLEYPLGSGYEHLVSGGLWFGAHAVDDAGAFVGVTTGYVDATQGNSTQQATEYTPAGLEIVKRGRNPFDPFYDPASVSDRDYLCAYSDRPARATQGSGEAHRPLNILVRQSVFSWASPNLQDFLVLRFVIINLGEPLTNAWAGLYTQLASGDRNSYACWPPSSACSSTGGWYNKKWLQYDGAQRLAREHYCAAQPVPAGCVLTRVPEWMGVQLLTPPTAGQHVTLAAWSWSPGDPLRNEDVERYAIMSAGTVQDLTPPDLVPQTGDPVELLALGPFASIASGDSVTVDFALVGGAEIADIQAHAAMAQSLHDAGFSPPTPTQLSLVSAQATPGEVHLRWYAGESVVDATVERREEPGDWATAARVNSDGSGYITFQDRDVRAGARYGYRVITGGSPLGEVWVDVPLATGFALGGVRPNPVTDDLAVTFSLPDASRARLELLDLAGRRLKTVDVGGLGGGIHVVKLGEGRVLPAGIYLVRLTRAGRSLTTRAVVIR